MDFKVGLFFYVNGKFLLHGCSLEEAEPYGDFLVYSDSHLEVWEKNYHNRYGVDFDFFPRGRVAYRKSTQTYQILYDRCIGDNIQQLVDLYGEEAVSLGYDEHYQCHMCNEDYIE